MLTYSFFLTLIFKKNTGLETKTASYAYGNCFDNMLQTSESIIAYQFYSVNKKSKFSLTFFVKDYLIILF